MTPTVTLSERQIADYHRDGFLTLPAIMPADEVARLRHVYDRLFATRVGYDAGNLFDLGGEDREGEAPVLPQLISAWKYAPELATTQLRANAEHIARQVLGPDCAFSNDHAILKPPLTPAETPWHQDEAYWDVNVDHAGLSIWVPLQDVDERNGCMQFIPGSHKGAVWPHHAIGNNPKIHGLEADPFDTSGKAVCPLRAGGATIHDARTMHYTGANATEQPRRAYILIFKRPTRPRAVPHDYYWLKSRDTARMKRLAAAPCGGKS